MNEGFEVGLGCEKEVRVKVRGFSFGTELGKRKGRVGGWRGVIYFL